MKALSLCQVRCEGRRGGQTEAEKNVTRLRNVMPEKLATFCKMHLSFLLGMDGSKLEEIFTEQGTTDCNANKRKLSMPFSRRKDRTVSSPAPLSKDLLDAMSCLISFLQRPDCLRTEGLFRKTGNVSRQRLLREWIAQGGDDLHLGDGTFSTHDVATVLKQLVIEMPEPLLTQKHYEAHMQMLELSRNGLLDGEKQVKALQLLVQLLPRENAVLLESLLDLLNRVAKVAENKMSAESLGIVFAPSVICPRKMAPELMQAALASQSKVVSMMIENSSAIFEVPRELADDVSHFWRAMEDVLDGSKSCEDRVNIRKSKYNSSRAAKTISMYADRKSPETFDCAQDTQVALAQVDLHDQSSLECASNQKLIDRSRSHYVRNKGKHSRSKSIGASIKKHLLRRTKSHEVCDSQSGEELGWGINKATSIESVDNISFNDTLDNKLEPMLRHSPAVHIVELEASPRKVRPYTRLINENIDDQTSSAKSQYRPPTPSRIQLPNTYSGSRPVGVVYPITKMTDRLPDVLL